MIGSNKLFVQAVGILIKAQWNNLKLIYLRICFAMKREIKLHFSKPNNLLGMS